MTYKELAREITGLTPEQLNCDVTVFVRGLDEFYPLTGRMFISDEYIDALNPKHPYLKV